LAHRGGRRLANGDHQLAPVFTGLDEIGHRIGIGEVAQLIDRGRDAVDVERVEVALE